MKRIMDWLGKAGQGRAEQGEERPGIPLDTVAEFLHHYPIGARVHYFPEYQRSVKLDTLVLGYEVDGQRVFSDHEVTLERGPGAPALVLRAPPPPRRLAAVERFRFLVPFQARSELDIHDAGGAPETFTEKNVNDFKRGNTITLFNKGADGKVPYLDCTVARVVELREGVYANRTVAVLEPDAASFQFLEQRQFHRVYTRVPASLSLEPEGPGLPCSVQDFTERSLRLAVDASAEPVGQAAKGARLYLTVHVPGRPEPFRLACTVQRRGEAYLVLALAAIWKDRRFRPLELIDELDLKTSLLHHPETQRALAEEAEQG